MSERELLAEETANINARNQENNTMDGLELLNTKIAAYCSKKGYKTFKITKVEDMVAFAMEGIKSKMYRKSYNKTRWSQLKALRELAEERDISVMDLLETLKDDAE